MGTISAKNIKVAHSGDCPDRSSGGSLYPYFLFTGSVSMVESRTFEGLDFRSERKVTFNAYQLKMEGVAVLPSGCEEPFAYEAETNVNGETLVPCGVYTWSQKLYVPVGTGYPFPRVLGWNENLEGAQYPAPKDPSAKFFGAPQVPDDDYYWVLPSVLKARLTWPKK